MRITTRIKAIETKLLPNPKESGLLIVLEDRDGTWHDGRGHVIDRTSVGPLTQVVIMRERPDGPS
jgi:hypothetical protein